MFQGAKVPGSESSRERMELSLPGVKVLRSESSCYLSKTEYIFDSVRHAEVMKKWRN